MTKTKSTKRALLLSALSLLMCVSMLIGSTFAWFTDSVTSAGNTIQSGTLDVDLVDEAGKSMEGEKIDFVAADGRDTILWEPGCTYKTEPVYVVNKGNLALKYKVGINGIDGDAKLLEAIEWTVTIGDDEYELSALEGKLYPAGSDKGASKSEAIVLSGHMKEEAGNEYQGLTVEGISITVFATQLTAEVDSFNDQYDAMATVDNVDELTAALAEKSVKIVLGSDIVLTEGIVIDAEQDVAIDLAGYTMSGVDTASLYSLIQVKNGGELTVMDSVGTGKISYDAGEGKTGTAVWVEGALALESGTIEITGEWSIGFAVDLRPNAWGTDYAEDATFVMNGGSIVASDSGVRVNINSSEIYKDTAVFTMNGGRINAAYDGIFAQHNYAGNAQVIVNNGTVSSTNSHAVRIYGDVSTDIDVTINGGNFTGKLTNFDRGDVSISGGIFSVDPSDYAALGYKAVPVGDRYEVIEYATVASTPAEMQKALDSGENVVLAGDVELTKTLMAKKDAVIDLNGNTMTAPSSGVMFQSQSNAAPDITITSSQSGAKINAGSNAVLLGYGSTEIYNVEINVDNATSNSKPFSVYGDLTLGEGTVVNINNLGTSLINNSGAVNIVIDGAKINVKEFKVNGGSMISINQATTVEMNNTEVTVGLNTTYTSYFVSQENKATINNCTFNVNGSDNVKYTVSETGKQWVAVN